MLRIHRLMQVDTGLAAPESIQSPQLYWNPNHACVSAYSFGVRSPEGMLTNPSYQCSHWYRENGPVSRQTLLLDRPESWRDADFALLTGSERSADRLGVTRRST